jgi:GPH family glycoside/pentoside/hexuronide:cation symporter
MSLFGALLSLTGYISTEICDGALSFIEQPQNALLAIRMSMGLIPAIMVLVGLLVIRRWPDRGAHLQRA